MNKQYPELNRIIDYYKKNDIYNYKIINNFLLNYDEINIINNIFSLSLYKNLKKLGINITFIYQHPIVNEMKSVFDEDNLKYKILFDKNLFIDLYNETRIPIFFIDDFQFFCPLNFFNIPSNIKIYCRYVNFDDIIKFNVKSFDQKKEKHYINQNYNIDLSEYRVLFDQESIKLLEYIDKLN